MSQRELMNSGQLQQALEELADTLVGEAGPPETLALLGIRTRGAILAERMQRLIRERHGLEIPLGLLDITLYRDDLSQLAANPVVRRTQLEFDLTGRILLLIDDVLYTGRTVRAALDEIMDFGRPRAVKLVVLVDRGGREIPVQADFVSAQLEVPEDEVVKVCVVEKDGVDQVVVVKRDSLVQASTE